MQEIVLNGKRLAPNQEHLYAQIATYVKQRSSPDKQKGYAAHLYKDIVGTWPPRGYHPSTAPWVEPTRNTLNKIRSRQIAYAHRRAS
jgi:hypothetical protein